MMTLRPPNASITTLVGDEGGVTGHAHLWFCQCSDESIPRHSCRPDTDAGLRSALFKAIDQPFPMYHDDPISEFRRLMQEAIDAALQPIQRATHLPGGENLALCGAEIGNVCKECLNIDENLFAYQNIGNEA